MGTLDTMTVRGSEGRRPLRADAQRSIAAIIRSATDLFSQRPEASMTEVARAAGVGRVTLYAHFPTREALIAAAVEHAVAEATAALAAAELTEGPADEALGRLIRLSWPILDRHRGLHAAAGALPPSHLRDRHSALVGELEKLIRRGQREGVFRTDLSTSWLAAVAYGLTHTAAEEVSAGRLDAEEAAGVLEQTLRGAFARSTSAGGGP
jgi:TetR/AcrR family transcriptional repressor of mexCD-oprJ operon